MKNTAPNVDYLSNAPTLKICTRIPAWKPIRESYPDCLLKDPSVVVVLLSECADESGGTSIITEEGRNPRR